MYVDLALDRLELVLQAGHGVNSRPCGKSLHALYWVILLHLVVASGTMLQTTGSNADIVSIALSNGDDRAKRDHVVPCWAYSVC